MSQENVVPGMLKLCVVYAPEDQRFYARFERFLKLLERRLPVELWSVQRILAGSDRGRELAIHLAGAHLLVYLFSVDLLDSEYYSREQLQSLVERSRLGDVQIFSVLLRSIPVDLLEPPFDKLALLPEDGKPVKGRRNWETALVEIAMKVVECIKSIIEPLAPKQDESAFQGPLWTVPYSRNAYFTGRDDLLAALHERLHTAGERMGLVEALTGLGGLGKTQAALEYAYRYRQEYQEVFWLRADGRENLASAALFLAGILDLPEKESPEQDLVLAALKHWFQRHEGWLLIFDDVTDLAPVKELLPVEYRGHVLLTSRMHELGIVAEPFAVLALTIEEGARWLLWRGRVSETDAEQYRQAEEIVRMLDGLPLALDQAGAYLEETGASLGHYLQMYQHQRADLLSNRGQTTTDHPAAVSATFALALEEVERLSASAGNLLRLCAFLHPATIPEALLVNESLPDGQELLAGTTSFHELNTLLKVLLLYSLVRRNTSERTLSVHRLVQAVLRDALPEQEQRMWAERAVALVSSAWPERGADNWRRCQDYLPHALECVELVTRWHLRSAEAVYLLRGVGIYLGERAVYPEAARLLRQALALNESLADADVLISAGIIHDLGWLAHTLSHYEQAEEYYLRALAIYGIRLGPEHLQSAQTLFALGLLYIDLRVAERAEPLLQRALAIRQRQWGPAHPLIAEVLNALGRLARLRKLYEQAETYYRQALAMREDTLGSDSPDVAISLANLGSLFYTQGNYDQAEPFYRRALEIRERVLGPEHPETAALVSRLALVLYSQEHYALAEPLIQRALALQDQILGREHPETVQTMQTQAMLYFRLGDYLQAQAQAEEALAIRERILLPQAPDLISSLNNLALIYREQKKYEQARDLLQRALRMSEKVHGQEHASTRVLRDNLAVLAQRAGWPAEDDAAPGQQAR